MAQVTMEAPAKVNLQLRVVGRRADGYHLLQMIMVPLAFGDTLVVSDAHNNAQPPGPSSEWYTEAGLSLWCRNSPVPLTADHLCVRAARAMRKATGRRDPLTIRLTKRTPVAAGLGGGSSDAAAVLRAVRTLWRLDWTTEALAEIGLRLGADVPFFCYGRPALVRGIGEHVTPLKKFPAIPILLANPRIPVPTAEVYRRYADAFCLTASVPDASPPPIFERFEDVTACFVNDLEPITTSMVPVLVVIRERLREAGADAVLMSGSGPTMFGVFRTAGARDAAQAALQDGGWWLCATEIPDWGVAKW